MNPFAILRIEIIKRPIFNLLLLLLALFGGSLGWAVIVLTLLIRLLLVRNAMAATQMQSQMTDFQPKIQEIQEKYQDDPQKQGEEMMKLFKSSGGGPLKGCLTMLIQIPVFLGLFYTVRGIAMGEIPAETYSFLSAFEVDLNQISTSFYGIDLLEGQNILLTIIAGVMMYFQMKVTSMIKPAQSPSIPGMSKEGMPDMSKMMGVMNYIFVAMMAGFVRSVPAAVGLYIVTTTTFGVIQQFLQYRVLIVTKLKALFVKK